MPFVLVNWGDCDTERAGQELVHEFTVTDIVIAGSCENPAKNLWEVGSG
jgi:hypothetical protein